MKCPVEVAIADDHAIFRAGLTELINSFEGFHVSLDAPDGQQLIEKIEKAKVEINICILDITMPGMNGYETLLKLREKWPAMKVLILTMHSSEFSIIRLLRNGANGYLLKGADPQELHNALKEINEKGYYSSDLMTKRFYSIIQNSKWKNFPTELSENEIQFLTLCTMELSYKEIAEKMELSVRTIEGYRDALFTKLGLKSRAGLIMYMVKTGLIVLD